MREFRLKRSFSRILRIPMVTIVLGILVFFLAKAAVNAYKAQHRSAQQLDGARQELAELTERNEFLENEIDKLDTTEGLEAELRDKFRIVKQGEKMVIIVEPEEGDESPSAPPRRGFWASVINFFK